MSLTIGPASIDLDQLLALAKQAGAAILSVYNNGEESSRVTLKEDRSPLTEADRLSHDIILAGLTQLTPGIPVLSEEGPQVSYEIRQGWECYWCVDPLDGTKEFIQRNGEFTVNIALLYKKEPVLGVIYIPVQDVLYYGAEETGSWKIADGQAPVRLHTDERPSQWVALGSRSHSAPEEAEIMARYPIGRRISAGSSLKFCLIAEGAAHLYYRHGPTMEWDTAAGHAIVRYSGGMLTQPSGEPFPYNKPSLLNGPFLCGIKQAFRK